jgi:hypothetical protein
MHSNNRKIIILASRNQTHNQMMKQNKKILDKMMNSTNKMNKNKLRNNKKILNKK